MSTFNTSIIAAAFALCVTLSFGGSIASGSDMMKEKGHMKTGDGTMEMEKNEMKMEKKNNMMHEERKMKSEIGAMDTEKGEMMMEQKGDMMDIDEMMKEKEGIMK